MQFTTFGNAWSRCGLPKEIWKCKNIESDTSNMNYEAVNSIKMVIVKLIPRNVILK